ncbi:MAG TPA: hypothetical protein EYP98_04210, partial [Planctomycetes bacterium]|nr:hypothetical protein [Planctomycetota bacterium]
MLDQVVISRIGPHQAVGDLAATIEAAVAAQTRIGEGIRRSVDQPRIDVPVRELVDLGIGRQFQLALLANGEDAFPPDDHDTVLDLRPRYGVHGARLNH